MHFNADEHKIVEAAAQFAEELVSNHFKMSSGQWLRNQYDIRTARDLAPHECVAGPYAQVIKYEARHKKKSLGSFTFSYYRICLQDKAILTLVQQNDDLQLYPFLLYVLTHELVHVVRFGKFLQIYEKSSESTDAIREEQVVHTLTYDILSQVSVAGLDIVLQYYSQWRMPS